MRKFLALLCIAAVTASMAHAGTRTCNTTLVTQNVCRAASDVVYALSISTVDPDGAGPRQAPSVIIPDALADNNGWAANMTCTQEMVDVAICTSGQLGTPVAVTKAKFGDMIVRRFIVTQVRAYRDKQEALAAAATVQAEPAPDVGN